MKNHSTPVFLTFLLTAAFMSQPVYASKNRGMLQGFIAEKESGNPLNGTEIPMTFRFYDGCAASDALFTIHQNVEFKKGFYEAGFEFPDTIKDKNGKSILLSDVEALCVGVQVKEDAEMAPRAEYASTPYALTASYADSAASAEVAKIAMAVDPSALAGLSGGNGQPGPAGPQGPQGPTGAPGPIGPMGPMGVAGEKGEPGPAGPQGPQGEKGDKGDPGDAGAGAWKVEEDKNLSFAGGVKTDNLTANILNLLGTTAPEDTKDKLYSVAGELFWNGIDLAKGVQGPKGDQGVPGEIGLTGPMGPQGPAGAKGDKGDPGAAGVNGATGPIGPQGPKGDPGAAGVNGATGPIGPQGPKGDPGDSLWGSSDKNIHYNGGHIGIGTTTPDSLIHAVEGNSIFKFLANGTNTNPVISLIDTLSNGKSLALFADTTGAAFIFDNAGSFDITADSKANIMGNKYGNGKAMIRVLGNGNVGVGTITPKDKLEVIGNLRTTDPSNPTNFVFMNETLASSGYPRATFQGGMSIGDKNWGMRFANAYSSKDRNIPVTIQLSTNNDLNYANASTLGMYASDKFNLFYTGKGPAGDGAPLAFETSGTASLDQAALFIDTVKNGQRVGIGTVTPVTKLDVQGSLRVAGQIFTSGTAPQADCGTVIGNDSAGKITIQESSGTCVLTFATLYLTNAPACVITGSDAENNYAVTTTTTSLTITSKNNMSGNVVNYICMGVQ